MDKKKLNDYLISRASLENLQRAYYNSAQQETTDGSDPRSATRAYIEKYIQLDEERRATLPEIRSFLREVAGKDAAAYRALSSYFFDNPSLNEACRKVDPLYSGQLLRRVTSYLDALT